ncbi:MAG: dTDP-4-dehydrorhamnose reductase [Rhodobacteraceae bacterium HLUCCA08]|nr:MAG: dTDP-4-dehydrorhamnose reductase [Rhodobacteraceae bacterium HLUCCA08]
MQQSVLILGAGGKLGAHSAAAFAAAGWDVRRYRRGTDMTAAARGVDVIVNGLNPPNYHDWAGQLPRITAQVIAAAKASGATVILPGNVYNFGTAPAPWSETTPQIPCSRKGQLRKDLEAAYRDSPVRTIVLRAGSFIDPDRADDVFSMIYLRALGRGRITTPGGVEVPHAFCYLPDWARAAVMLADRRADLAGFEDIPFPGHCLTTQDIRSELEAALGRPLKTVRFAWGMMRLASPFWELARELLEMRYLWDTPHWLSDTAFTRHLPDFRPADRATVIRAGSGQDVHPDKPMRPGGQPIVAQ